MAEGYCVKCKAKKEIANGVEAGATDVVAYCPRLLDQLAEPATGRIHLDQKIASERVHHRKDLTLELHKPRFGFVPDLE